MPRKLSSWAGYAETSMNNAALDHFLSTCVEHYDVSSDTALLEQMLEVGGVYTPIECAWI